LPTGDQRGFAVFDGYVEGAGVGIAGGVGGGAAHCGGAFRKTEPTRIAVIVG